MKSFIIGLDISSTGLRAQRIRINTIASNIANINTTRTDEGGPYVRKEVIFSAKPMFNGKMWGVHPYISFMYPKIPVPQDNVLSGVEVYNIVDDPRPPVLKYDPYHPDADENGYVAYPNINTVEEMVNLISAQRAYEANVAVASATKDITLRALEIGR